LRLYQRSILFSISVFVKYKKLKVLIQQSQ
jgi:hypothetical protein